MKKVQYTTTDTRNFEARIIAAIQENNEVQINKEISLFEHMYKTSKYSKDGLISDSTFEFWTNTESLKEMF